MTERFNFVDAIAQGDESAVLAKNAAVEFILPAGTDVAQVVAGGNALNGQVAFSANGNVLSVLFPPDIEVGSGRKDLKEALFLAGAHADIGRLGAAAAYCCAKEGGCCVRW